MMILRGKYIFLVLLSLMAISPAFTQTAVAATPTPTETGVPLSTATSKLTPTPDCVRLVSPVDGTEFPRYGRMTFSWETLVNAASYQIVITPPNGKEILFSARETRYSRYAESFPWGGEYQWKIIALDKEGEATCTSSFSTFKKPEVKLTQTNAKPADEEGDSGGGGGVHGGDDGGDGDQ